MRISRRGFLQSAAVFSALGVAPRFLTQTAAAAENAIAGFGEDRVLVVVQLGGGNDGLNTVVPFGNDLYHKARPSIGIDASKVHRLNDEQGLNPELTGLMRLYDAGALAVIQGVGYPNPDRSHFRSMEIWQTASDSNAFLGHGWIGRYFDNTCSGSARPQVGLAVDSERPQAFSGEKGFGVAAENPDRFGWQAGDGADTVEAFRDLNAPRSTGNRTLDFLRHTTQNAISSSDEVQAAAKKGGVEQGFGRGLDFRQLDIVAGLIRGGLETRIYYVSTSGFDTHANQVGQHDRLLQGFGEALHRFQMQLEKDGTADRVVTMVFSEFGRRVQENGSRGTDHGTAAPMFLAGKHVRAGLHGTMPSLSDLDAGDLKHTVDFRSVYASVLEDWFQADSAQVLQRKFETLGVIA